MRKVIFLLGLFIAVKSSAQLAITGPACGIRGIQYQYLIAGTDTTSTVSVCVSGGSIVGSADSCLTGNNITQVLVTWDKPASDTGRITVSFNGTQQELEVPLIPDLQAGVIDSAVKSQLIDSAAVPLSITCSLPAGGSCNPNYTYQWQRSADNNSWTNIDSATGQNLDFSTGILENTFYRRKVFESQSNTYGFSDVSAVFIKPTGTATISGLGVNDVATIVRQTKITKGL